jgi:uncharacterized protein (DUF1697 family)
MRFAALLRGINVGTSIKVPMVKLKSMMEDLGYGKVVTYLNSGNVLFDSESEMEKIQEDIEIKLSELFIQKIPVLVKSSLELKHICDSIPAEWANDDIQKSDVAYLFKEADSENILESLPIRMEYIDVRYVGGALLWNVSRNNYNMSHINKIVEHRMYGLMTIRNVNTARQLAKLSVGYGGKQEDQA